MASSRGRWPRGGRRPRGEVPPRWLSIGSGRLDARASRRPGRRRSGRRPVNQVLDDRPLSRRVPARCAGFADDGCVQGFRAPAVAGADAGASRHEIFSGLTVVSERRGVQRGCAFIDLDVTVVDEELIAARKARRRQRRRGVERCPDESAIARRDRHQQPREILGDSHKARYPAGTPTTAATPSAVIGVLTHLARSVRRCLRSWPIRCRWVTAASPRVSPATPPAARRAADRSARSCG